MQKVITEVYLKARIFSAIVKSFRTSSAAFFHFSLLVTFADEGFFTTRMPPTFSWTELFKASYFLKIRLKIGWT